MIKVWFANSLRLILASSYEGRWEAELALCLYSASSQWHLCGICDILWHGRSEIWRSGNSEIWDLADLGIREIRDFRKSGISGKVAFSGNLRFLRFLRKVAFSEMWQIWRSGRSGDLEIWQIWRSGDLADLSDLEIWQIWRFLRNPEIPEKSSKKCLWRPFS